MYKTAEGLDNLIIKHKGIDIWDILRDHTSKQNDIVIWMLKKNIKIDEIQTRNK